ncbi:MAG: DNA replication/repair protein RecF [Sphingomonadales bacterium]|nr:MAG: DNA replication/repair protein RecF [Sphingomonadales bacterium]
MTCRVSRLLLTRYRSYPQATIEAGPGLVAVVGANGIGKTNILEALSLLSPGRGLRAAALNEFSHQGAGGWAVAARVQSGDETLDLGTGESPDSAQRRVFRANGEAASSSALARALTLIWLTPAQDRLFLEAPAERRRFLDRMALALAPEHAGHVARYEAALRERQKLLSLPRPDAAWLDILEQKIAEQAVAVAAARLAHAQALAAEIAGDGAFPAATLALEGVLEQALDAGAKALAIEDDVRARLKANRAADAQAGRAQFGPHRCDLLVTHRAKQTPAHQCSTGEQKALLIGLVLAQAQLVARAQGRLPILLLDEVAAHLDADRRAALFHLLNELGVQAWMTGTDRALFASLGANATLLTIDDGRPMALALN